jgi:uncharacterized membrane protein (DUF2068 family)
MTFLLIVVYALILLMEAPGLIKKKYWRELIAFSVLLTLGFTLCILQTMRVNVPNPVKDTQYFVKSLIPFSY